MKREFKWMYLKMKEKKIEIPRWLAAEWNYKRADYNPDFLSKDLDSITFTFPDWSGKHSLVNLHR
jgi:hypothetical protein